MIGMPGFGEKQLTRDILLALGEPLTAPAVRQLGPPPLNGPDPALGTAAMNALRKALERAGLNTTGLTFTYLEQQESFPGTGGYWNHYIQVRGPNGSWANLRADLVRDWPEVAVNDITCLFALPGSVTFT
jgi:hypothetical protein